MTYDAIALDILLSDKPEPAKTAELASLADEAAQACGSLCPDCGSRGTEDNGSTEYRCCACDHRWGFDGGPRGERYGF